MQTGDGHQRKGFQIDPSQPEEYLAMARQLVTESADMLMVQPSLFAFDMLRLVKDSAHCSVGAYSVLGELEMFKASGYLEDMLLEHAIGAVRAGADFIVTYGAHELATALASRGEGSAS
jgi:porphobilinogen synthase